MHFNYATQFCSACKQVFLVFQISNPKSQCQNQTSAVSVCTCVHVIIFNGKEFLKENERGKEFELQQLWWYKCNRRDLNGVTFRNTTTTTTTIVYV